MTDFIIKVRALIDCLSSTGDNICDRDKIDFVANGLGDEFHPFVHLT